MRFLAREYSLLEIRRSGFINSWRQSRMKTPAVQFLPDRMTNVPEIPRGALNLPYNDGGFLPHVGLHRRGELFYQESSYSHFWLLGVMLAAAIVILLLPWSTMAGVGGKLKYWIAGICVWGGICGFVPYFIRNAWGQNVTIDPKRQRLSITSNDFCGQISWQQIVGLQICRQKIRGESELNGYQLNLVWLEANGTVRRHCLLKHAIKGFVVRLGRRYETLFDFKLIDHTRAGETDSAANDSQAR